MTRLTFPSVTFPGRPSLSLDLPPGWQPVPTAAGIAGAALAAVRTDVPGPFRANVFVVIDEVPPDHAVHVDLAAVERAAAQRRDGVVGDVRTRNLSGVTFFGRDLTHTDETAGPLLVSSLFGFVRRDADRVLVRITVTGTISLADGAADHAALHRIVGGLQVAPAPGTTALLDPDAGA